MKTKTLDTIQKIFNASRIISKIVFVFSVVGFALSLAAIITLPTAPFKLGVVNIQGLVNSSPAASKAETYAKMIESVIFCAGEAVLAKLAERYFKKELEIGTPFSFESAKQLRNLGICIAAVSFGITVMFSIAEAVFNNFLLEASTFTSNLSMAGSVGIGIALIVMSFLCKYGAEILKQNEAGE